MCSRSKRKTNDRPSHLARPTVLQDAVNIKPEEIVAQLARHFASKADRAGREIGGIRDVRSLAITDEAGLEAKTSGINRIAGNNPGSVRAGRLNPTGWKTASRRETVLRKYNKVPEPLIQRRVVSYTE